MRRRRQRSSDAAISVAVRLEGIWADYGDGAVLRGVDLDVQPGEVLALLGPSGCGKTTLLRCIGGLEPIAAGTIRIGERVVSGPRPTPPERRNVGMVFQDGALFPHLSALDNVGYGLARPDRRGQRARDLLRLVGLEDKADRQPGALSGGEQQRVALARALARQPGVLLMDEPFSSLDAGLRVQLRDEIRQLLKEIGVTTVFVTHDQDEALVLGDRVAVMRDGIIEQLDTPARVYRWPASPWVARFVGEASLLPGRSNGRTVLTAIGEIPTPAAAGPVSVLCRPEQLALTLEAGGGMAHVAAVDYFGQESRYLAVLADGTHLTVRAYGAPAHAVGDVVRVVFVGDAVQAWRAET